MQLRSDFIVLYGDLFFYCCVLWFYGYFNIWCRRNPRLAVGMARKIVVDLPQKCFHPLFRIKPVHQKSFNLAHEWLLTTFYNSVKRHIFSIVKRVCDLDPKIYGKAAECLDVRCCWHSFLSYTFPLDRSSVTPVKCLAWIRIQGSHVTQFAIYFSSQFFFSLLGVNWSCFLWHADLVLVLICDSVRRMFYFI